MKKKFRVKKSHEFQTIIGKNEKYTDYYFIIYKVKTTNSLSRFGISVGKKLGNAVVRNKFKRQIRSIIQKNLCHIQGSEDVIIIAKTNLLHLSYQQIEKNLEKSLKKAKIINV